MVLAPRAMGPAFCHPPRQDHMIQSGSAGGGKLRTQKHHVQCQPAYKGKDKGTTSPPGPGCQELEHLQPWGRGGTWPGRLRRVQGGVWEGSSKKKSLGASGSRLKSGRQAWPIGRASVCAPPPQRPPSRSLQTLRSSLLRGHPPPLAQSRPHLPISPSLFRSNSMYFSGNHRAKTGIN